MSNIGHKAILASAGSGKTFQLAHRYIRILADKDADGATVGPDRICAMTFTRKAAGEIFDNIAKYLLEAAEDSNGGLKRANENLGGLTLSKSEYLSLLRSFIDNLHKARIGTFDSFIVGIAKAFPVELGIPMNFQVTDSGGSAAQESRQKVLDRILSSPESSKVGKTFLDAFKMATIGIEEKKLGKVLDDFLTKLGSQYRLCPDGSKWGNEKLVWPEGGLRYTAPVECDVRAALKAVTKWHDEQDLSQTRAKKVYDFVLAAFTELAAYDERSSANELLDSKMFGEMLEQIDAMREGDTAIHYYNVPYVVPAVIGSYLADLIHNMLVIEYQRMLSRTVGLYTLLGTYDSVYDELTKASGGFSFTDIQYLLGGAEDGGGRFISREEGADRLYIDYRMDCSLDHWLLDEFQDTSDLQWSVFENMISEIVQSGNPDRSFFYVGDVKQAIYRWRGGNHGLFLSILDKFNEHTSLIEVEPKQTTYRCSQPVIDAVNKVFSDLPGDFPAKTIEEWSGVWKRHETVASDKDTGYVTILEPGPSEDPDVKPEEQRCQLVADLLNEMQPVRRGLSVGVLVRGNDYGKELVNVLCKECEGMNFVHEGESGIAENEAAQLLISMVRAAAHPGDEFAWQYIMMTPMADILQESGIHKSNISISLLSEIHTDGFQVFVRKWGGKLAAVCDLGDYGMDCLERFESAAAEFDSMGQYDCNSFLNYMDTYTVREQPSSKAVRVMTIHQSKGLEFDVVILPQLQGGSESNMVKTSGPQLICAGGRSEPEWILRRPKKVICENDKVLNAEVEQENAAHCFDSLCVLYVAMTRARHGLYIVTSGYKSRPSSVHASVFVKTQLAGEGHTPKAQPDIEISGNKYIQLYKHEGSSDDWYKDGWEIKKTEDEHDETVSLADGYAEKHERCEVLRHREPSKQAARAKSAGSLFEVKSSDVMDFGSAIHEMFERVEWTDNADVETIIKEWEPSSRYDGDVTRDAIVQFRKCMESPELSALLGKPKGNAGPPWLEKRFEVVLDGGIVSGAFDRVIIKRDNSGIPVSAVIVDYKSSLAESEANIKSKIEDYTAQMHTYRDALAIILRLSPDDIELKLLFTRQQTVASVV